MERLVKSAEDEVALYVTGTRSQLDEETFTAAWAEGQAMSIAEAVEHVLEEIAVHIDRRKSGKMSVDHAQYAGDA